MSKRVKYALMAAMAFSFIGGASLAEAGKIRSTVERRQSPGKGFWDTSHKPTVRHHQQRSHGQFWKSIQSLHQNKSYRSAPKSNKKSWGWQRSIQDRRQRPGGR